MHSAQESVEVHAAELGAIGYVLGYLPLDVVFEASGLQMSS